MTDRSNSRRAQFNGPAALLVFPTLLALLACSGCTSDSPAELSDFLGDLGRSLLAAWLF